MASEAAIRLLKVERPICPDSAIYPCSRLSTACHTEQTCPHTALWTQDLKEPPPPEFKPRSRCLQSKCGVVHTREKRLRSLRSTVGRVSIRSSVALPDSVNRAPHHRLSCKGELALPLATSDRGWVRQQRLQSGSFPRSRSMKRPSSSYCHIPPGRCVWSKSGGTVTAGTTLGSIAVGTHTHAHTQSWGGAQTRLSRASPGGGDTSH
jgi:hypothetical protein